VLGGSSENAQRQYAGDEEDLLLQYAIRQSLDTDTTASEQVENLTFRIIIQPCCVPCAFDLLKSWKRYGRVDEIGESTNIRQKNPRKSGSFLRGGNPPN
jgi:hypothetical protein